MITPAAIRVFAMPDHVTGLVELWEMIARDYNVRDQVAARVWLERTGPMPLRGSQGNFTFGRGYGNLEGIIAANHLSFDMISAKAWQKLVQIYPVKNESYPDHKKRLHARMQEIFPGVTVHRDSADALLIAEALRRSESGNP